jgi:formyl-CoA transferase
VALSASAPSIVQRVLRLTGGDAVAADPRFGTAAGRVKHVEEIDAIVGGWIGRHTLAETMAAFEKWEGAIAPVYDVAQIFEDPQFQAREDIIAVPDAELGSVKMQNVTPRLSRTPGAIRHAGPRLGEHNREILEGELGLAPEEIERLRAEAAI